MCPLYNDCHIGVSNAPLSSDQHDSVSVREDVSLHACNGHSINFPSQSSVFGPGVDLDSPRYVKVSLRS
jgi:hypothetical protein